MKTVIYYFTGTGNTLAVARDLAEAIGDTKLVPLRQAWHAGGVSIDADAVGIAFPVYFLDVPSIVREFVQTARFSNNPYIFGLATCGERPGGALFRLRELLAENGNTLSSGFAVVMPENFIGPVDLMGDAGRREEKFTAARRRIPEIAETIRNRQVVAPEGTDSPLLRIGGRITRTLATSLYNTPRRLHSTAACNRCGTCTRVCPARNISLEEQGLVWGNACIQCYACIHWCPQGAIEIGNRTRGKERYHNPAITIRDMLDQRGG